MAINKNHEFEELNGVKCAIVEKNATKERVDFLKSLLEYNKFTVIIVAAPAPKPAIPPTPKGEDAAPAATTTASATESAATVVPAPAVPPAPELFTIGVTDVMFNPINAIFGRLLSTADGHVVTLAYWQQKEKVSHDEVPYYEAKLK